MLLLVAFALSVFFLLTRERAPTVIEGETRYHSRTLLIPNARFLLPVVEEELLNPRIQYTVDPDAPLDAEFVEKVESELMDSLREELILRVDTAVEELLFD